MFSDTSRKEVTLDVVAVKLADNLEVLVAEAHAVNVGAIVVPHLAQLELHGHLVVQLADDIVVLSTFAKELQRRNA